MQMIWLGLCFCLLNLGFMGWALYRIVLLMQLIVGPCSGYYSDDVAAGLLTHTGFFAAQLLLYVTLLWYRAPRENDKRANQ